MLGSSEENKIMDSLNFLFGNKMPYEIEFQELQLELYNVRVDG